MSRQGLDDKKKVKVLSKRDRVLNTFDGQEVDRRPYTFWYPFGLNHMKAESMAAAALTFAATYGVDLLRVPLVRDLPLKNQVSIDRPHDITQIAEFSGLQGFWGERFEALKLIYKMAEKKLAIFETIPGPLTALGYVCRPDLISQTEEEHPQYLEKGIRTLTSSLQNYLSQVLKEDCLDGLVVEIESATFEQREPENFESMVKPYLKELLNFVRQESEIPIWLHVRGTRVYPKPLVDLPHNLISWPHLSSGPKLERAFPKGYQGPLAGGLNEQAIATMSPQDIRRHVEEARNQYVKFLCTGDQFPADISPSKLKALANYLSKRDWEPGDEEDLIDDPD